jgi:hypothetical protein
MTFSQMSEDICVSHHTLFCVVTRLQGSALDSARHFDKKVRKGREDDGRLTTTKLGHDSDKQKQFAINQSKGVG